LIAAISEMAPPRVVVGARLANALVMVVVVDAVSGLEADGVGAGAWPATVCPPTTPRRRPMARKGQPCRGKRSSNV
jgi:hypothetical protein